MDFRHTDSRAPPAPAGTVHSARRNLSSAAGEAPRPVGPSIMDPFLVPVCRLISSDAFLIEAAD